MKVPTNLIVELDVRADTPGAITAGLEATAAALRQGVEPNTIWGRGYCVGIKVGGKP